MRIAGIAAVAALALGAQVSAAQQPGPPPGMAEHMRMMDSLNARLDTLVSRMNRATGNQKVTAMADVINEMVAHRKLMHAQMRAMLQARPGMMPGRARPAVPGPDSAADTTGGAE